MSEFKVQVVRVGKIDKHPNADSLSITKVWDYPVIIRTEEFKEGDLAVYVPVDSVVPKEDARWTFLLGHNRIKAKRLRGVFSMGLLVNILPGMTEGQLVDKEYSITKYEAPFNLQLISECERDPGFIPVYTDIEGLRRWPNKIVEGEEVVITEKIHGCNARFAYRERLYCGSRTTIKKRREDSFWWIAAEKDRLEEKLSWWQRYIVYGEIYGQVQDLRYDVDRKEICRFIAFDIFDTGSGKYVDYGRFTDLIDQMGLVQVPILYSGPWSNDLRKLAEGKSTIANNVREGIVIRPIYERYDDELGRVILKLHGEGYLTRKEK